MIAAFARPSLSRFAHTLALYRTPCARCGEPLRNGPHEAREVEDLTAAVPVVTKHYYHPRCLALAAGRPLAS